MSDHGPSIDGELIRVFILVYIHSGYKNVSDILHVDRSTIKKKIARLEEIVGEKLFERHGNSIILTQRGRNLMLHASKFYATAAEFSRSITKKGTFFTESLNLAGPAFITEFVASKILSLQNVYIDSKKVVLSREIQKSAVSYLKFEFGQPASENTSRKNIGRVVFVPAASLGYLSQRRFPQNIEEAVGHRFIFESGSKIDMSIINSVFGKPSHILASTVYVPDFNSKMSMVRYGAGIGVVPLMNCTPDSGIVSMNTKNYKCHDLFMQPSQDLYDSVDIDHFIDKIRNAINECQRHTVSDGNLF